MQVSEAITKKSASNLALAFILLPPPKRQAMCALYAFCREIDDVADEESTPVSERRISLQSWREDILKAFRGGMPAKPVNVELASVISEYKLPYDLFDDLIRGVEMDLEIQSYETILELEAYCYRVASVVGLLSIEVFGYKNPKCHDFAIHLGKALQLTNILRDVQNDAARGRIYLPSVQMQEFGVSSTEIFEGRYTENYRQLASWVSQRAREHYRQARRLLPSEDRGTLATAELMGAVYWKVLLRLESRAFDVFNYPLARLNKAGKAWLILNLWLETKFGLFRDHYGQGL